MLLVIVIVCITALKTNAVLTPLNIDEDKELQLVHVVCRHGKRTPADTYKTDPYINETFDPYGWGALTNDGKKEMFEAGQFIRKRYNKLLGDIYNPKEYYVQTTDSDRTKMSAQLVNAGLWPPKLHQIWGNLNWQPIPAVYEPLDQDSLLLVRQSCPAYFEELEKVEKDGEPLKIKEENAELFKKLTNITGDNIKTFDDVQSLYSTLIAEETFGLKLPEWTKEFYPDKLKNLTEFSFVLNSYNDKLKKLKGGVLLKKIITDCYIKSGHDIKKRLDSFYSYLHHRKERGIPEDDEAYRLLEEWKKEIKNSTPNKRKMVLYTGHDSTVANLLSALKVWDPQVPNYGITAILECSKDRKTGETGIEIYLRNITSVAPFKLNVPGCGEFCPLTKLTKLVTSVIPRNMTEECKPVDPNYKPPAQGGP